MVIDQHLGECVVVPCQPSLAVRVLAGPFRSRWYSIKRIASSSLSCRRAKADARASRPCPASTRNGRPHFPSRERHIQHGQGDEAHVMVPTPPGPRFGKPAIPRCIFAVLNVFPCASAVAGHRRLLPRRFHAGVGNVELQLGFSSERRKSKRSAARALECRIAHMRRKANS